MTLLQQIKNKLAGLRAVAAFDNMIELVVNRTLYRDTGLAVYRLGDMEVLIDHKGGDQNGTRECLVSDMYARLIPHLQLEGAINLVDIGANGGGFTLLLRHLGISIQRAVCVEMNPSTFRRMQFNLQSNMHGTDVVAIHAAVCGEPKELRLDFGRGSTGESIYGSSGSHTIAGITLDDVAAYVDGPIDLLKMDIEGAEYEVLFGEHATALSRARYVIIEIHTPRDGHSRADALAKLGEQGFDPSPLSRDDVYLLERRV